MTDLAPVYAALSAILRRHTGGMAIRTDAPDHLYIERPVVDARGKPRFFGAVQVKRAYVSYHLMPVYEDPGLLAGTSDALRKRMQGKSCFNFKTLEPALFAELDALTARCAATTGCADGHG